MPKQATIKTKRAGGWGNQQKQNKHKTKSLFIVAQFKCSMIFTLFFTCQSFYSCPLKIELSSLDCTRLGKYLKMKHGKYSDLDWLLQI